MKKLFLFLMMIMMTLALFGCSNNVKDHFYFYCTSEYDNLVVHLTSKEVPGKTIEYRTIDVCASDNGEIIDNRSGNIINVEDFNSLLFSNILKGFKPGQAASKVIIDDEICLDSTSFLFYGFDYAQFYGLEKLDMKFNQNMSGMFAECVSLQTLDISKWDVSKVTDMSEMFYECKTLQTLDISKWDVSKVKSMSEMFYDCEALHTLDISKWNVSNVTNFKDMFYCCGLPIIPTWYWEKS